MTIGDRSSKFLEAFEPFFEVAKKLFGIEGLRGKTIAFGLDVQESEGTPEQAQAKRDQAVRDGKEDANGFLRELKTGLFQRSTHTANPNLASMPTRHIDPADLEVVVAFMMPDWRASERWGHYAVVSFRKERSWDGSGIVSTVTFSKNL